MINEMPANLCLHYQTAQGYSLNCPTLVGKLEMHYFFAPITLEVSFLVLKY